MPASPCTKRVESELPFILFDANEVILLALLKECDPFADQRVGDDDPGLWLGMIFGGHDDIEIVADESSVWGAVMSAGHFFPGTMRNRIAG
jgi:hypothetical protein